MIADKWTDYEIIASGGGEKLENWCGIRLLRPDPQAIWPARADLTSLGQIHARYERSSEGGGGWNFFKRVPEQWQINYRNLKFSVKPMGFKHLGLFPEQAINWDICGDIIASANRPLNVLNLFAYTGAASVACAKAGAKVTHVDSAKGMVERAGQNARLNGVEDRIRFIIDDCFKFVSREIKRGSVYDAVIMDPPSYGRGPKGETWRLEDGLYDLVKLCVNVLSDNPVFFLINSYTTGLQPTVISNILALNMSGRGGNQIGYELCLPTSEGIPFPCGCSGLWTSSTVGSAATLKSDNAVNPFDCNAEKPILGNMPNSNKVSNSSDAANSSDASNLNNVSDSNNTASLNNTTDSNGAASSNNPKNSTKIKKTEA